MSYIEVDQSGKIEQFDKDTVVALSNDRKYSILIPKTVKQDIFIKYKARIPDLKYKLFSISLFYCLAEAVDEERKTVICTEYTGKDRFLKSELVRLLKQKKFDVNPKTIDFGIITKESPAHSLAIGVLRRIEKPDLIISRNQIEELLK